jgi:aspartyl-tRNA(Asn)/glutamyl-tRNA(Gln) amidotransferase subunit A
MDDHLAFAPASEQRELIVSQHISPVELTELYFRRIETLDAHLNAYLTLTRDQAMVAARAAEAAVMRGDELGPLHGVPISIKDLELTKGIRTTSGSVVFQDRIPDEDSIVVERVRQAGAITLGKTNVPEFGLIGANENRLGDHCRNPWNPDRTTGASSGGAGAAVAAGLCALATGSDGGGSIRIPSSFCGVYGIKPTQGRVPRYSGAAAPVLPNPTSQSGPMARTVRDAVLLLHVMAGYDPRDPTCLRETPPDFLAAVDRDIRGLRLAWSADFGYAVVDPEVASTTAEAARQFEGLGCSVEESGLALESHFDIWWTLTTTGLHVSHGHLLESQPDQLTWYVLDGLRNGAKVTGAEYAKALGRIDPLKARFADLFETYDLLLSPTMPVTAMPVGHYPRDIGDTEAEPYYFRFLPFTYPINLIGHPAASIPCGFSSDGLPIGLHLIGRRGDEATVIAASAAFERASPWIQHRPTVS